MALIKCPECGATVSDKADACPACGCPKNEFNSMDNKQEEKNVQPQATSNDSQSVATETPAAGNDANVKDLQPTGGLPKGCKRGCLIVLIFVLFCCILAGIIGACDGKSLNTPQDTTADSLATDSSDASSTAANAENKNESQWSYSEETDKLMGKTSYFAKLVSEDYTTFDFPYNNSLIYLTINVRSSPRYGTDVYLTIPEGQFMPKYEGTYISVRFDEGKVTRYRCSEPSDNSTTVLFLNDGKSFIKKLKSSKECRISAEFFQEGSPTFTFKTEGFVWNH